MTKNVYIAGVVGSAAVGLVLTLATFGMPGWGITFFLGALVLAGEWFAVEIPVFGSASLSFAIGFASIVLGGPSMGVAVHAIGSLSVREIAAGRPPVKVLFNASMYIVTGVAGGLAYSAMGMTPLLELPSGATTGLVWLLSAFVIALVLAVTNMALVGIVIALDTRVSLLPVLREWFRSYLPNLAALALLGIVLAQLVAVAGIPATLLLVVPFAVARQTFQVYNEQSEAFRETVKSLVTALEAKDPYTRGHSERVAWYARAISEETGLSELETQRVEWGALLHDIGKVAISRRTLTKPEGLSSEEYELIREHPRTAARILDEIELLDDIVPFVAMHHERLDGKGYPEGVPGDQLPMGARILAVADCYDAMTSDRAYRGALSFESAVAELNQARGGQLDGECVDALLRRVDDSTTRRLLEGSGALNG